MSLSSPLSIAELIALLVPPNSLIYLEVTQRLGHLLPVGTQTGGFIEELGTFLVHRVKLPAASSNSQHTKKGSFYSEND
jgi:hypothetical protein